MHPSRKVDNQTFVFAIGLLSSLLVAVALWCFNAVAAIRTDVSATNAKVAATDTRISTVVDVGNASAQSLQLTLGRIQTDVDWIKRQLDAQQQGRPRP
jgi:hypothetical protein